MNLEERRKIKKALDILLYRKNIIFVFILFGLVGGMAFYLSTPKAYRCTALLKYQRQSVNPTAMSPDDIRTQAKDAVDTVSQQILSRSSLEEIVNEFALYPEMLKTTPMEDVVEIMREEHIDTNIRKGSDIFEVSYLGNDQNKVLQVTNVLASKFIEENLRYRQERASQTSSYVKDELKMAKEALDEKELAMRDYKLKYYNEMPDQLANNMNRLNALQVQHQTNQKNTQELEHTKLLVQEQIALRKEFLTQLSAESAVNTATTAATDLSDIDQVRLKLQNLRTRYTEKHPEVRRLKKILSELEAQQDMAVAAGSERIFDPQIEELKQQLKDIELSMVSLKEEREELQRQINKYEQWIAAAPVREAEWSALTRDYEQLNHHYQNLVTQSLQAESAQTLENQQRGSQFKIVDPAHFPEKPFKPNFVKIMLAAIIFGTGLGTVAAFGFETASTSFKDPNDIENYLGVPVICAIPAIRTRREQIKDKVVHAGWYSVLCIAYLGIVVIGVYFWKQGMIIL